MRKAMVSTAIILGATSASAVAGTTVLTVGSGGQFSTMAAAVAAADADTNLANEYVIKMAAGTYTNDTAEVTRPMTIEAAVPSSSVILDATAALPNEKGILLALAPLTVDGLTFENAQISNSLGGNGAGIRNQDTTAFGTMIVRNSIFINNQMGILASNSDTYNFVLSNNLFMNNGNPNASFFGHAVYIGPAGMLVALNNEACGTNIGHDIKSRAMVNIIGNNTLYDGAIDPNQPTCNVGSSSLALDIANGGQAVITGNLMIQGAASQNFHVVDYAEEGLIYSINSFTFSNNVLQNTESGAIAFYYGAAGAPPIVGSDNTFTGFAGIIDPASAASLNQLISTSGGGTVSSDGTTSIAPSGTALTNTAGTWAWGGTAPTGGSQAVGQYTINLNGVYANGWGAVMEVNKGGQLYVENTEPPAQWWVRSGSTWVKSAAP